MRTAKVLITLVFFGWALAYSVNDAIDAPTSHLDGAFQTASSLFRLDAGQLPGRDFLPYLGIGPTFILYPIFEAAGANLAASVIAAQFAVLTLGGLATATILHITWQNRSFTDSVAFGFGLFITLASVAPALPSSLIGWFDFGMHPGHSLRPIRAFAPYLLAALYCLCVTKIGNNELKQTFNGLLTGSILLWSNDYAIPSAGLFAVLSAMIAAVDKQLTVRAALIYLFSTIVSWALLLSLATLGHPIAILKYNFIDVAGDQWWLFGPYGEDARVFRLQQIGKLLSTLRITPLVVLGTTIALAIKTKSMHYVLASWLGLSLFAGGAVASIGGHLEIGYFDAFFFWGAMTLLALVGRMATAGVSLRWSRHGAVRHAKLACAFSMLLIAAVTSIGSWSILSRSASAAQRDTSRFYVAELGAYLDRDWVDYIDLARKTDSKRVIEEYWGLWSATRRIISACPTDSVISALGNTREIYRRELSEADVVISTRHSCSPIWQPWNLTHNYWFYEELLERWSTQEFSPNTVVWRKGNSVSPPQKVRSGVNDHAKSVEINAPEAGFYEVELEYSITGGKRLILMARNDLSFASDCDGYGSLAPGGRTVKYPVYISNPGPNSLPVKVIGSALDRLSLLSCVVHRIPFTTSDVLHLPGSLDK